MTPFHFQGSSPVYGSLARGTSRAPVSALACALGAVLLFFSASAATAAEPPQPTETITYKTVKTGEAERNLKLLVEKPTGWKAQEKRPAVVYFFGGGWVKGNPGQFQKQSEYLATRGVVGVRVEYRTLPDGDSGPPEICAADAKSAIRYVRSHAAELGIDPDRIAAAGGSAGGHLAALTGLIPGLDDEGDDLKVSAKPNALVLFNPVFDGSPGQFAHARFGERWKEFSPLQHVSKDAPPAIAFLGDQDKIVPVASLRAFEEAYKKAGVRFEARIYPGAGHAFFNRDVPEHPWFTDTLRETDRFLASLGWIGGEPTLPKEEVKAKAE